MRAWENFIKTELKKSILVSECFRMEYKFCLMFLKLNDLTIYLKDDIIILSTIRELKRVFTEDNYEVPIWNF